jgi:2-desacetyl-2-hydroxyethyl bacteriochlorophyllide A dehydrogenase
MARSLWFAGPRHVEVRSQSLRPVTPGHVRVETLFSGISAGTEMLAYRGQLDPDLPVDETIGALGGTFRYPFQYGYSCVGRVVESSADTEIGSLVFAFHPHQDAFVIDADQLITLPEIDPRTATMLPFVETALQVTLDAGPVLGQTVVVVGLGLIGLLTSLLVHRAGGDVLAIEPRPGRRETATALGIPAVDPEEVADALADRGRPDGVALVIEASGQPAALAPALDLLDHEGHALVASWYGQRDAVLPLGGRFHRRRLTIRSTQVSTIPSHLGPQWNHERRRQATVSLLATLPLAKLGTHTFDLADAPAAYAAIDTGEPGLLHVALGYR